MAIYLLQAQTSVVAQECRWQFESWKAILPLPLHHLAIGKEMISCSHGPGRRLKSHGFLPGHLRYHSMKGSCPQNQLLLLRPHTSYGQGLHGQTKALVSPSCIPQLFHGRRLDSKTTVFLRSTRRIRRFDNCARAAMNLLDFTC